MKYKKAIQYYEDNKTEIEKDKRLIAKELVQAYNYEKAYSNYTSMFYFAIIVRDYKKLKELYPCVK